MGLGGACKKPNDTCSTTTDCVKAPIVDPANSANALGLSSYFALKVTDQNSPELLWEFSSPDLGFSTSGPAIIRVGNRDNNGRWFAVFASGPTGPIAAAQFRGTSNQNLKIFVLDLKSGALLQTIDTGIQNAFAGSLANGASDSDRWNPNSAGNYQDDALYFGYTQKDTSTSTWTKGGVLRLLTKESINPADWSVSTVISNIGPVTSALAKLQDRTVLNKGNLWLYFGTGRYFYKVGTSIDDADGLRALYGIKEPCYDPINNKLVNTCTASISVGNLTNQTTTISSVPDSSSGWIINLAASSTTYKAERTITDPVASPSGAVFFTTYEPTADVCSLEGQSFLWGVNYNTGGFMSSSSLQGEVMIQVSTGSIEERKLSTTFGASRKSAAIQGKGSSGMSVVAPPLPVQKFMHIKER
jgi:type IV pilus assembly protein PilY1